MTDNRALPPTTQHIRLPRDATSGALHVMDNTIIKIMDGKSFHLDDVNVVPNTNSRTLLLTTPNTTTRIYLSFAVNTNVLLEYFLYENPTISNVGTDLTSYNKDRNSSATATLDVNYTPTVSSAGTVLSHGYIVTNNNNIERSDTRMWKLKANEEYLVRATNNSGGNANVTILLDWYEE